MEEIAISGTAEQEIPEIKPNKLLISGVVGLGRLVFHPHTHFEDENAIREHRDQGGVFQILMTHFNRLEPGIMAQLAGKHESLRHLKYTTGVTARAELWDIPVLGTVLRNINAAPVRRVTERPNETEVEKLARQDYNQRRQAIAGRYLGNGNNWIIWPEGSSRKTVEIDSESVRVPRDKKKLLPIRKGFAYSLDAVPEGSRDNVKMLAIASYFGERALSVLRATVYVSRPTEPLYGSVEKMRQQGEALLSHGLAQAIKLDELRR